jgi:hypothetical protein
LLTAIFAVFNSNNKYECDSSPTQSQTYAVKVKSKAIPVTGREGP